jgi:hypothetical protein
VVVPTSGFVKLYAVPASAQLDSLLVWLRSWNFVWTPKRLMEAVGPVLPEAFPTIVNPNVSEYWW